MIDKKQGVNLIFRFGQSLSKQAILILPNIILANYLDAKAFGSFSFALGVISMTITVTDFGISTIAIRDFVEKKKDASLLLNYIYLMTFLSVLSFIILINILPSNYNYFSYLEFLIILTSSIASIIDAFLRAEENFISLFLCSMISAMTGVTVSIFLFFKIGEKSVFYGLLTYSLVFILLNIRKVHFRIMVRKIPIFIYKKLSLSLYIGIPTIGYLILSKTDIFLLAKNHMFQEIGYFEYLGRIIELFIYPFGIISQVFMPSLLKMGKRDILNIYKKNITRFVIIILIITLSIVLLHNLMNSHYPFQTVLFIKSIYLTILLYPIRVCTMFINQTFLIPLKLESEMFKIYIIVSICHFCLSVYFIPFNGLSAVFYISLVTSSIILIWQNILLFNCQES